MTALVLVVVLFVGTQASAQQPGCDPSRTGVTHGADGANPAPGDDVPCLTYGFFGFGEGNVAVSSSGAVMYGGAYHPDPQPDDCPLPAYEVSSNLARSENKGAVWEFTPFPTDPNTPPPTPSLDDIPATCSESDLHGDLPLPPPAPEPSWDLTRGNADPRLWRDPLTDRIFLSNEGSTFGAAPFPNPETLFQLCETELSYTDDGGATWTHNPDPLSWGCSFFPLLAAFDFPYLFTAPRTTSAPAPEGAYPNVVYVCKRDVLPVSPGNHCYKSLDSLVTLTEIPGAAAHLPGGPNGYGGLDGTIYGIVAGQLHYSTDEGTTWTVGAGAIPIPGGISSRFVVDSASNVYVVGVSGGKALVAYSKDRGATWSTPVAVQAPGVNHVHDTVIAVPPLGAPGPVAVAYTGNGDAADGPRSQYNQLGGVHHGYITMTENIFASDPVFRSVQVDPDDEPLLPYGFPASNPLQGGRNTTTPSRVDYIGIYMDEPGLLQISQILQFFDQSVDAGNLVGTGPGRSAAGRLGALRNMLETSKQLLDEGGTPWAYFFKDLCGAAGEHPFPTGDRNITADPAVCDCPKPGVCDEPNPQPVFTNWMGAVATVQAEDGSPEACTQLKDAQNRTDGDPKIPDFVTGAAASDLADRIGELRDRLGCG